MKALSRGAELFLKGEVLRHETPTAMVAYRKLGEGPPLVFLHGWPLWSFTFRKLLPYLIDAFTCYLIDLPGGGDTVWTNDTDFTWPGQAATVKGLLEGLGLDEYSLYGQDSGAMIARHLCLLDRRRIHRFILTNTEIPGHRPSFIPTYRRWLFFPGSTWLFRLAFAMRWFVHSRAGFGGSMNPALIDGEFYDYIIQPLVKKQRRMAGHSRFLRGWSWRVLDRWSRFHREITMPVLFLWGDEDQTFPIELA